MDSLISRLRKAAMFVAVLYTGTVQAQTIFWSSPANAVNLTSSGSAMNQDFRFELGVFTGSFVPTAQNKADWAVNWNPIERAIYNSSTKRYVSAHTPDSNAAPFTINKPVYVWGFSGDAVAGEWILFRASTWLFPDANPPVPPPANTYEWFADALSVTAIAGSIERSGSPFLMRSESVTGVVPPTTTWSQWRAEKLAGTQLDGPGDDPDGDGVPNVLEFGFGLNPLQHGALPAMPLTLERVNGHDFMQIRIPRRKDHAAIYSVQVSSNLVTWNEGGAHVEIIADDAAAWIVRDKTPYSSARFMRLKATPEP